MKQSAYVVGIGLHFRNDPGRTRHESEAGTCASVDEVRFAVLPVQPSAGILPPLPDGLKPGLCLSRDVPGFEPFCFTDDGGARHQLYVANGGGPPVILLHELPGLVDPDLATARRLADLRYTVIAPLLFGEPGGEGNWRRNIKRVCGRDQSACGKGDITSPQVRWLRQLSQAVREQWADGNGVGVIGMCLTGALPIAMLREPSVAAAVLCQPTIPFNLFTRLGWFTDKRALGIDPDDLLHARTKRCPASGNSLHRRLASPSSALRTADGRIQGALLSSGYRRQRTLQSGKRVLPGGVPRGRIVPEPVPARVSPDPKIGRFPARPQQLARRSPHRLPRGFPCPTPISPLFLVRVPDALSASACCCCARPSPSFPQESATPAPAVVQQAGLIPPVAVLDDGGSVAGTDQAQQASPSPQPTNPFARRPVCSSMFMKSDWRPGRATSCNWIHNGVFSTNAMLGAVWSAGFSQQTDLASERGDGFPTRFGRKFAQNAFKSTGAYLGRQIFHEDPRKVPPYLVMRTSPRPRGFLSERRTHWEGIFVVPMQERHEGRARL